MTPEERAKFWEDKYRKLYKENEDNEGCTSMIFIFIFLIIMLLILQK